MTRHLPPPDGALHAQPIGPAPVPPMRVPGRSASPIIPAGLSVQQAADVTFHQLALQELGS